MSNTITAIHATIIQNSRGTDTLAVTVEAGEHNGTFALPDGASTGSKEVHVKPAGEALKILEEVVSPALIGMAVDNQQGIDDVLHELDDSTLLDRIGGNTALGVSVASSKTASASHGIPVWQYISELFTQEPQARGPRLFVNLINGGKHATFGSPIQEHQIIPETDDVALAYQTACDVQQALEMILIKKYGRENIGKGDEGGFMIPSTSVFEPFELINEAIDSALVTIPVHIGADIAASSFYKDGVYALEGAHMNVDELLTFYATLHSTVPRLKMVEDPFFEADFDAYAQYVREHQDVLVIGDDLTTTNILSLERAIEEESIQGIIIKPNQIGTLSDTLNTMALAYAHGISCIVSHRSGETEDDFIADLAFGTKSFGLKAGAPKAREREVKYQRLINIQKTHND